MKKMIALLLSLLFLFGIPLNAAAEEFPAWFNSEEALMQHVFELSFEELAAEINEYNFSICDYAMIIYAAGLLKASEKIPDSRFEEIILSDKNCTALRYVLVEIAEDQNRALNTEKLASLIRDEKTDADLKPIIVDYLVLSDHTDLSLITGFIEEEGELAAQFLRLLAIKNRKAAMPYIEKTLSSYTGGEITPLVFNALAYKAVDLSDKAPEERAAFIRYCDGIIKALPASDAESREEVLYALKNMRCAQTLEYVLELDSAVFSGLPIDKKIFCCGAVYDMKEFVYELYDESEDKPAFAGKLAQIGIPLLGDADGDQGVTAADARLILRSAVGLEKTLRAGEIVENGKITAVDMDGDGKITAADARVALRTAVGLEKAEFSGLPRISPENR